MRYHTEFNFSDGYRDKLALFETWYALLQMQKDCYNNTEIKEYSRLYNMQKDRNNNAELKAAIKKKFGDKKIFDENDESTSKKLIPFLVKIAGEMRKLGNEKDQGRELLALYLEFLLAKKSSMVHSSLKLISEMDDFECNEIFPQLSGLDEFITEALEPRFIDKKPSKKENELLLQFILQFLNYLTQDMSANSNTINKICRLMRHLNLLQKEDYSLKLFKACAKDDDLLLHFVEAIGNSADEFFDCRHTLNNYEDQNHKKDFRHLDDISLKAYRQSICTLVKETFKIRSEYPQSYEATVRTMLKAHFYDTNLVLSSLEKEGNFLRKQREEIFDEVEKIAPIQNHLGGFSFWFKVTKIFTFLSVLNQIADYLLDWKITLEYYDWFNYLSDYNCTFWSENYEVLANRSVYCIWEKIDQGLGCQRNVSNVLNTCTYEDYFDDEISDSFCNVFQNELANYTSSCGVVLLNNWLSFAIGIIILLASHLLQFLVLYVHFSKFKTLICYIRGDCCPKKYQNEKKNELSMRNFAWSVSILVCGIFLQFLTKIFATVIMAVHLHQAKLNREKYRNLKLLESEDKMILYKKKFDCNYCKGCSADVCICFNCGHLNVNDATLGETTNQDEVFNEEIESIHSNLLQLDRLDRLVTGCFENTYMPIVQLALILPLVADRFNSSQFGSVKEEELTNTVRIWGQLFFTIVSITSSLIGLSTTAIDLHFKRDSKEYKGTKLTTKIMFHVSMILQISSRLLLLSGFGLIVFFNHRFMPLYLIAIVFVHCCILLLLKLLVRCANGQALKFENSIISSFLSAYTYVVWDVSAKDNSPVQDSGINTQDLIKVENSNQEDDTKTTTCRLTMKLIDDHKVQNHQTLRRFKSSPAVVATITNNPVIDDETSSSSSSSSSESNSSDDEDAQQTVCRNSFSNELFEGKATFPRHLRRDTTSKIEVTKSIERLVFCLFIWIQHGIMCSMILHTWYFGLAPQDLLIGQFLVTISAIFVIGHWLEWYYHIMLNPFAKKRKYFETKKYLFYAFTLCLVVTIVMALIITLVKTEASQYIFGLFLLIILSIGVIFYINSIKMKIHNICKKSDQKSSVQIDDNGIENIPMLTLEK